MPVLCTRAYLYRLISYISGESRIVRIEQQKIGLICSHGVDRSYSCHSPLTLLYNISFMKVKYKQYIEDSSLPINGRLLFLFNKTVNNRTG